MTTSDADKEARRIRKVLGENFLGIVRGKDDDPLTMVFRDGQGLSFVGGGIQVLDLSRVLALLLEENREVRDGLGTEPMRLWSELLTMHERRQSEDWGK